MWGNQQTSQHFKLIFMGNCIAMAAFVVAALWLSDKPQRSYEEVAALFTAIIGWLFLWPLVVLYWKNLTRLWRKTS